MRNQNEGPSKLQLKLASILLTITGVCLLIFGLLSLVVSFIVGLFFIAVAVLLLIIAKKYRKMLKQSEQDTNTTSLKDVHAISTVESDPQVLDFPNKPEISNSNVLNTKTENFHVAGISFRENSVLNLAQENDDYSLSKKEIIEEYLYDEKIFQYTFDISQTDLIPEPGNEADPNAVKVVADGQHIGYIKAGSCSHVKKILASKEITNIQCLIVGGKYKAVWENDEKYELERGKLNYGATVQITYVVNN